MTFTPSRARDAWFVIQGFVYQVEVTIVRWLALGPYEALELERGEDIDTISAWCAADGNEARLLEQVKHLEGAVTLNSAPVRTTLANFVEHRAANPATDLRLRFVTTAGVGQERAPAMARGMTGLEAWKTVRSGAQGKSACLVPLAAIRRLLRQATKPESVPVDTWAGYRRYLDGARAAEMAELVFGVEWSTSAPDLADLQSDIRGKLVERGWAGSDAHAEQLYRALFMHTFHLLCRPGIKRLTPADRSAVLEHPDVSDRDAALLTLLRETVGRLESRVADLAEQVAIHDTAIASLGDQVVAVAATFGMRGQFSAAAVDGGLSCPRPAERRALRATAVAAVGSLLDTHTWVALHGTSGAGKTELALLVAEGCSSKTWLGLRDLDPDAALFCIHAMLAKLAPKPNLGTNEEWFASAAAKLPAAHLLILDDFPTHDADGPLGRDLNALVGAFGRRGLRILSTSARPTPQRTRSRLGAALHSVAVPPFSDEEVSALLVAHGAPPAWLEPARVTLLRAVTAGHAELLLTAAVYLARNEWLCTEAQLRALLSQEYASSIEDDVMRRLLATVESASARQLLFRVALSTRAITTADVAAIAEAEPAIEAPRTALTELQGLWLQTADDQRYTLCPLAKTFTSEVPAPTGRRVHRILGDRIVGGGVMGPIDAVGAITHYVQATDFGRAGSLLLLALSEFTKPQAARAYDAGLLDLWCTTPLPEGMDLGLRVYIRALQVQARGVRGHPTRFLVEDLLALAEAAVDSHPWALLTVLPQARTMSEVDFPRTAVLIARAVQNGPDLALPGGGRLDLSGAPQPAAFLWHQSAHIGGAQDARAWLASLVKLGTARLQPLAKGQSYEWGCFGFCDGLWLLEAKKPKEARDWASLMDLLEDVHDTARELGLGLLGACARRAQVIIRADYQDDLTSATTLADDALVREDDATSMFLVAEAIGRQHVEADRPTEGRAYLERALGCETTAFPTVRLYASVSLSRAVGAVDRSEAARMLDGVVASAATINGLSALERSKLLGEAAIARWLAGDLGKAARLLLDGAKLLFACRADTRAWRDAAVLFGHVGGYFAALAATGRPPVPRVDSGESSGVPAPGLFHTFHEDRDTLYSREREGVLLLILTQLADWCRRDAEAVVWATTGLEFAKGGDCPTHTQFFFECVMLVEASMGAPGTGALSRVRGGPLSDVLVPFAVHCDLAALVLASLEAPDAARGMAETSRIALELRAAGQPVSPALSAGAKVLGVLAGKSPTAALVEVSADGDLEMFVRVASLLATSVRDDRTYGQAFGDQVVAAWELEKISGPGRAVRRRILSPLVRLFWADAVDRSAFQFSRPSEFKDQIARVVEQPPEEHARLVLSYAASALGVNVPNPLSDWLALV